MVCWMKEQAPAPSRSLTCPGQGTDHGFSLPALTGAALLPAAPSPGSPTTFPAPTSRHYPGHTPAPAQIPLLPWWPVWDCRLPATGILPKCLHVLPAVEVAWTYFCLEVKAFSSSSAMSQGVTRQTEIQNCLGFFLSRAWFPWGSRKRKAAPMPRGILSHGLFSCVTSLPRVCSDSCYHLAFPCRCISMPPPGRFVLMFCRGDMLTFQTICA